VEANVVDGAMASKDWIAELAVLLGRVPIFFEPCDANSDASSGPGPSPKLATA
jgi:hypothetical protein